MGRLKQTIFREGSTTTLLPDGRVLVAFGSGSYDINDLNNNSELYDPGFGFANDWRPAIASMLASIPLSSSFTLTGSGFRGVGNTEASSGGTKTLPPTFRWYRFGVPVTDRYNGSYRVTKLPQVIRPILSATFPLGPPG